jgi:hypothetical protein
MIRQKKRGKRHCSRRRARIVRNGNSSSIPKRRKIERHRGKIEKFGLNGKNIPAGASLLRAVRRARANGRRHRFGTGDGRLAAFERRFGNSADGFRLRRVAIENSLLYQEQEKRAEELALLKEFNESIVESVNVGLLAVDETGASRAAIRRSKKCSV